MKEKWTKEKYQEYINNLLKEKDEEYIKFYNRISKINLPMLGLRLPYQRTIAKEISKTDIESFIKYYEGKYFEERMILGLSIAYTNNKDIYQKYLYDFSKEIIDWSICDSVAMTLKKTFIKNKLELFPLIDKLLNSNETFQIRFGLVIMLSSYINDETTDEVLERVLKINSDEYYINMAKSWILCEIYIKYPDKVDKYINKKYLSDFVLRKTISKICDSYRVSKDKKEELKQRR